MKTNKAHKVYLNEELCPGDTLEMLTVKDTSSAGSDFSAIYSPQYMLVSKYEVNDNGDLIHCTDTAYPFSSYIFGKR